MSVADSVSNALKKFGRPMVLRRYSLAAGGVQVPLDVTVYGTTDGAVLARLIGATAQLDGTVIISNAEIEAAQWPGPPRAKDKLLIDGKERDLLAAQTKYLGTTPLVHICQMRG